MQKYGMNDDFLKSFPGPAITIDTDDENGDGDQYENEDEDKNDDHGNGCDDDENQNTDDNEYAFFCGRRVTTVASVINSLVWVTTPNIPSESANAPAVR